MNEEKPQKKENKKNNKICDNISCCGEIKKSCNDNSCCQETKMKRALKDISCYAKCNSKKWLNFIVGSVMLLLITGVLFCFFSNCCQNKNADVKTEIVKIKEDIRVLQKICGESKKPTCKLNESKIQSVECKDVTSPDLNFHIKGPSKDSLFNLSMETKKKSNSRSDCFWFIIVLMIILFLIVLFYFTSHSSRENKLLEFAIDWNEQEKEIKLKKIEKCKEIKLKKIKKKKNIKKKIIKHKPHKVKTEKDKEENVKNTNNNKKEEGTTNG